MAVAAPPSRRSLRLLHQRSKRGKGGKGRGRNHRSRKATKPPSPGPARCSPFAATRRNGASCLPQEIKRRISSGKRGGSNSGSSNSGSSNSSSSDSSTKKNGAACAKNDERCLVETSDLSYRDKKNLISTYFRPAMPSAWKEDPDMWLNSDDIHNVMKQYEKAYPEFRFLGVVPIDFSAPDPYNRSSSGQKCMNDQFCHVDIAAERAAGRTTLGAIFNLDPHYKGGSHWVSLAIDLKRNKVYYFDSYGIAPPPQVARFMRYLTLQEPRLILESNGRRFQFSDTECGMYSLYFLIRMIKGADFKKFVRNPIPDKWMLAFRNVLFDPDATN